MHLLQPTIDKVWTGSPWGVLATPDQLVIKPRRVVRRTARRVCMISTINHNVGDDFVREGILWLLQRAMDGEDLEVQVIHKHAPVTARAGHWHQLDQWTRGRRGARLLSDSLDRLPLNHAADAVLRSDLVIQSGAPVYWKNRYSSCAQTEWFEPLIERRWTQVQDRVPLLNLGAGACQAPGSDGSEVAHDASCRAFIRKFHSLAALTTVRDPLAQQILRNCGVDAPLLPCPSIFASRAAGIQRTAGQYVALNYMPLGGHYDLADAGPEVSRKWERVFVEQVRKLASEQRCLLICHDQREVAAAARLLPEVPRFFSHHWQDYLRAYARSSRAIVNRVHGAVVTAAMGRPVLLVGNDTRMLTAAAFPGVTTLPVTADEPTLKSAMMALLGAPEAPGVAAHLQKAEIDYLVRLQPLLANWL
jgi:hypothetical protein